MKIALLAVVLAACGSGGAGDECSSSEQCDQGLFCTGPNGGPVCGIAPHEECTGDNECQVAGDRCHAVFDGCSADGIGSECRAACAGNQECGESFECVQGACVAIPCDAGFACATRETCDPGLIPANAPVYDQHHGCFAITCAGDGDCSSGLFCVNGICQDGPGSCEMPLLVP